MIKIKPLIEQAINKGLPNILGANVFNKLFGLTASVIIVRILTKEDYGYYGWAYNIVSIFLLFSGLGINQGVLQYCSENIDDDKKKKYYKFGITYGLIVNIIITIILIIYSVFFPLSIEAARWVLVSLSLIPTFECAYQFSLSFLRSKKQNKLYSRVINIQSFGHLVWMIGGALLWGLKGYIAGYYLSYICSIIYSLIASKDDLNDILKTKLLSVKDATGFIKYSLVCAFNNGMSHLLYVLDVFLIGIVIPSAETIASYKASTQIPVAMYFLTTSIIVVVYPYFAAHFEDSRWVKKNGYRLLVGMAALNIPIGLCMFFCAPIIIRLIYGVNYFDSVPVFRVATVSYIVCTVLKIPCGNMLAMVRKVNVNFFIDMISGVSNIILDIILISNFGSLGAAYATLIVNIIAASCVFGYFIYYTKRNTLQITSNT